MVEAFKTWCHHLKDCKFELLVLTDHNNQCQFIDTKSFSSRQVWWTLEISRYYFSIDCCQMKFHTAADSLSRFPRRSQIVKKELQTDNTQIFHPLKFSSTNSSFSSLRLSSQNRKKQAADHLPLKELLICGTYVSSGYGNIEKNYVENKMTKNLIGQALMIKDSDNLSCKQKMRQLEKSVNKAWWMTVRT